MQDYGDREKPAAWTKVLLLQHIAGVLSRVLSYGQAITHGSAFVTLVGRIGWFSL